MVEAVLGPRRPLSALRMVASEGGVRRILGMGVALCVSVWARALVCVCTCVGCPPPAVSRVEWLLVVIQVQVVLVWVLLLREWTLFLGVVVP
jgi:hypothetical protein